MLTIGIAGLSHLGIVTGTALASLGHMVIGYDARPGQCEALERGELPFFEPGLEELLVAHRRQLRWTHSSESLSICDLVYVALDVPTDHHNQSDLRPLRQLVAEVGERCQGVKVILSQVPPGFTRTCPGFFYQVETLVFGQALERALHPERYIVGVPEPSLALPDHFQRILGESGCPILCMSLESAELAKIAINCCLVATLSTANQLAELCERIGADWSEIIPALRLDRRIGPYAYLQPGLGLGGGNLERDLATVIGLGREHGSPIGVIQAQVQASARRRGWVEDQLRSRLDWTHTPHVGLWGLAYKPGTASIKNSPALDLIERMPEVCFRAYDPQVTETPVPRDSSPQSACRGAEALVVMTAWPEFARVEPARLSMAGKLVLDPYASLNPALWRETGFEYMTLGRSNQ